MPNVQTIIGAFFVHGEKLSEGGKFSEYLGAFEGVDELVLSDFHRQDQLDGRSIFSVDASISYSVFLVGSASSEEEVNR
jgi:hypothetical protein